MTEEAGGNSPYLDEHEREQAAGNATLGPLVIHEIVREQGEKQLARSFSGLGWSGLSAGLSIGFSFMMQGYLQAALPDAPWTRLIASLVYTLGYLIVVLAQQELYTETTLTALIPALTRRDLPTMWRTLRVWAIVLGTNLVGTLVFALVGARTGIFTPEAGAALAQLSAQTMAHPFLHTAISAAAAGWLIGLMVWLLPAAGPARPLIIIILTYAVAVFQLPHIIVGSVEAAYGMFTGAAGVGDYFGRFLLPTLIGNTLGGTALVALLNHAPIAGELRRPARA